MKILLISEEGRFINSILDDILKDVLNMDDDIRPDTEDVIRVLTKAVEYNSNLGDGFDVTINNGKIYMGRPDGRFYAHYAVDRQEDDYYTFTKYGYEANFKSKVIYNDIPSYNCVVDVLLDEMRGIGSKKIFSGNVNETSMVIALAEMLKLQNMNYDYDGMLHKCAWMVIDKDGMVQAVFDMDVIDEYYNAYDVIFKVEDICTSETDRIVVYRYTRED